MHTQTEGKARPLRSHEINLIWSGLLMLKSEQLTAEQATREAAERMRAAGFIEDAANWERCADGFQYQAATAAQLLDFINADALSGSVNVTAWAEWVAEVEQ